MFVLPIFAEDDPNRIDYMQVSVTLPAYVAEQSTKQTASGTIAPPMTSPNIEQGIEAAQGGRDNVINFPAVFGELAVVGPVDVSTVAINPHVGPAGNRAGV